MEETRTRSRKCFFLSNQASRLHIAREVPLKCPSEHSNFLVQFESCHLCEGFIFCYFQLCSFFRFFIYLLQQGHIWLSMLLKIILVRSSPNWQLYEPATGKNLILQSISAPHRGYISFLFVEILVIILLEYASLNCIQTFYYKDTVLSIIVNLVVKILPCALLFCKHCEEINLVLL